MEIEFCVLKSQLESWLNKAVYKMKAKSTFATKKTVNIIIASPVIGTCIKIGFLNGIEFV